MTPYEDGELISRDPDAPRFCAGSLRVVGIRQLDARNTNHLRDIASDLRGRGFERCLGCPVLGAGVQ